MRHFLICVLLVGALAAKADQFSLSIGSPNLQIGLHVSDYPELVAIPGYPVYYAPQLDSNYFFYDGMYWVYQNDNWYASSWYDGPWSYVDPNLVPLYMLRVPVRYYRRPPMYFREWTQDSSPRWGQRWGSDWQEQRRGWDHWDHRSNSRPLPLPLYQRQYSGEHYPDADHQRDLHRQNYPYLPRNSAVVQHYNNERTQNDRWRAQEHAQPERNIYPVNDRQPQPSARVEQRQPVRSQVQPQQRQDESQVKHEGNQGQSGKHHDKADNSAGQEDEKSGREQHDDDRK